MSSNGIDSPSDWQTLRLDDEALVTLQLAMISDPQAGRVVEGTGGLRKLRFAPASWKTGKSGGARICYVYFEEFSVIYLLRAYAKNERDDLDESEKDAIRKLILKINGDLAKKTMP
ncbi:MAG: addiction module toxin RelE [Planctomycetes bacterium]|nr:addiction module toxin RelE [Planctomycetota bacterium]